MTSLSPKSHLCPPNFQLFHPKHEGVWSKSVRADQSGLELVENEKCRLASKTREKFSPGKSTRLSQTKKDPPALTLQNTLRPYLTFFRNISKPIVWSFLQLGSFVFSAVINKLLTITIDISLKRLILLQIVWSL